MPTIFGSSNLIHYKLSASPISIESWFTIGTERLATTHFSRMLEIPRYKICLDLEVDCNDTFSTQHSLPNSALGHFQDHSLIKVMKHSRIPAFNLGPCSVFHVYCSLFPLDFPMFQFGFPLTSYLSKFNSPLFSCYICYSVQPCIKHIVLILRF